MYTMYTLLKYMYIFIHVVCCVRMRKKHKPNEPKRKQ